MRFMKYNIWLVYTLIFVNLDSVVADSPISATDSRLNGEWVVITTKREGREVEDFDGSRIQIDGNSMKWRIGERLLNRVLVVDRLGSPNFFDQIVEMPDSQAQKLLGIYKFDRDKLIVCFTVGGIIRPKTFDTTDDKLKICIEFKRPAEALRTEKKVRSNN